VQSLFDHTRPTELSNFLLRHYTHARYLQGGPKDKPVSRIIIKSY